MKIIERTLEKLRELYIEVLDLASVQFENNEREEYLKSFDYIVGESLHMNNPVIISSLDDINKRINEIEDDLMDFHISAYRYDLLNKEKDELILYRQRLLKS